jgi:diacylglycerol kinase family enzyme
MRWLGVEPFHHLQAGRLDGEIAVTTPADFTIERNAVHVVVPQSSTSALFDGPGTANWPS